mgnify:CR=1 FL=1
MSQINVKNLSNENEDGAPKIESTPDFSATSYMVPPKGTTAQRPENPQGGDLRFNTDTASLEYFKGDTLGWTQIEMTSPDLDGGARGVWAGGYNPAVVDNIDYITIATLGNATDFGNLTTAQYTVGATADRTRGILAGGRTPSFHQNIDYITISSTGNAVDSGSDLLGTYNPAALASSTRGVFAITSGPAYSDAIDYITIQSIGTAVDFGNLTDARGYGGACSSSTRGLYLGGIDTNPPSTVFNIIDYITIASTGNAVDFGDMTNAALTVSCASNSTRGLCFGGSPNNSDCINVIQYITIATTGNAVDFGDISAGASKMTAAASSPTRAVVNLGVQCPAKVNTAEYVQIATTGNGTDFGDMLVTNVDRTALSNAHGGL